MNNTFLFSYYLNLELKLACFGMHSQKFFFLHSVLANKYDIILTCWLISAPISRMVPINFLLPFKMATWRTVKPAKKKRSISFINIGKYPLLILAKFFFWPFSHLLWTVYSRSHSPSFLGHVILKREASEDQWSVNN